MGREEKRLSDGLSKLKNSTLHMWCMGQLLYNYTELYGKVTDQKKIVLITV